MFKISIFLVALIISVFSVSSFSSPAATYQYSVKIPATANSCADEALVFGNHFGQVTGMSVVSSTCLDTTSLNADGATYPLDWILVTYSAADPNTYRSEYAAVIGTAPTGVPPYAQGAYDTYSSCLADLNAQTQAYEKNTGYQSVVAFCGVATGDFDPKYFLEIDGFGAPQTQKSQIYVFQPPFMTGVDSSVFAADAANLIAANGGDVVRNIDGAVVFYSNLNIPVSVQYLSYQSTMDNCTAQMQEAQSIAAQKPGTSLAKCVDSESGGAYLTVMQSQGYLLSQVAVDPVTFPTFDACMEGRKQAEKAYGTIGLNILGSLCFPGIDNPAPFYLQPFN